MIILKAGEHQITLNNEALEGRESSGTIRTRSQGFTRECLWTAQTQPGDCTAALPSRAGREAAATHGAQGVSSLSLFTASQRNSKDLHCTPPRNARRAPDVCRYLPTVL